MGMFDYIHCKLPLPVPGFDGVHFQTKDTPSQFLSAYEIREDGTLWYEAFDVEDRSDPQASGIRRVFGSMTRVNKRWERVDDFSGNIRFYNTLGQHHTGWIEFAANFVDGKTVQINLIEHRPASPEEEKIQAANLAKYLDNLGDK